MLRKDGASAFTEVNVEVTFKGEDYIVLVSELAAVETKSLRNAQGDLSENDLRRALDRVFTGF